MLSNADPIIAISTAPGQGGIGVIRISFGQAEAEVKSFIQAICQTQLQARKATYLNFIDESKQTLDRGIALLFPAPHSYTGETVLELQGHGGPIVLQLILKRCLSIGASFGLRLAEPGEFTHRAFLNDKLDLAQAEAVADLINASTEAAARSASRSLEGAFSKEIHQLVDQLIQLRMLVEATLDFPEEEIDFLEAAQAHQKLQSIHQQLQLILVNAHQGALLKNGLSVVLAGQPNVGKSSLLNALAGAELAIVTSIAGTTRDKVTESIQLNGIPLHIIDTAGLRETEDEIEKIGITRSWQEIEKADVILHLIDIENNDEQANQYIRQRFPAHVPIITLFNKIDIRQHSAKKLTLDGKTTLYLSAKHQQGIDLLRESLLEIAGWQNDSNNLFLARERHLQALQAAQEHINNAQAHAQQKAQHLDLYAEELRLAQEKLNSITGEFSSDDLLGVIFSQFCIGK